VTARRADVLQVLGVGAATSIGLTALATAAAVAGNICRYQHDQSMRHYETGEPVTLAMMSSLPDAWTAIERMLWFARLALEQAVAPLLELLATPRVSILLSIPPERPGLSAATLHAGVRAELVRLPFSVVQQACGVYDRGHEGGISALLRARELIEQNACDICIVGGFDCGRDGPFLDWLAQGRRLKSETAPTGLVPGEGAAFLLIGSATVARRYGLTVLAGLSAAYTAVEPHPWYLGRSTQGRGLSEAIGGAFKHGLQEGKRADVTYCDLSGEPWRADEWSMAYLRTAAQHGDPLAIRHPADCWGDVGAASAPLLLVTALLDLQHRRARGDRALVWCASDTRPFRGAALLDVADHRRPPTWP
jgi:3-oxoacyl-[acyl-carrier-protein] synthase-1